MRRWALIVALLYGVILVALSLPAVLLAFAPRTALSEAMKMYATAPYWLWIAVMVIGQVALLAVPVRIASRRPVTRRRLWLPVIATGLMMAGLAIGAIASVSETIFRGDSPEPVGWIALAVGLLVWVGWSIAFHRAGQRVEAHDFLSRQCRLMLQGSVLELLIAVPTHIVARARDYCCAGMLTFIGLTMGISVMLFSFGPAVYFLFADRWRRTHNNNQQERPS